MMPPGHDKTDQTHRTGAVVNLTDPAFLIALALGVGGFVWYLKTRKGEPEPLRCPDCREPLELEQEIIDPENPELRYIPGERRGQFVCRKCGKRVRGRY
jgi:uncharacterized protein YbaR (Trm112 family)